MYIQHINKKYIYIYIYICKNKHIKHNIKKQTKNIKYASIYIYTREYIYITIYINIYIYTYTYLMRTY